MDEQEIQALAALDARARRAAEGTRDSVAAHAKDPMQVIAAALPRNGDGMMPGGETDDGGGGKEAAHDAGDVVPVGGDQYDAHDGGQIPVGGSDGGASDPIPLRPGGGRRRVWLAAAAVFVLALTAVAFVTLRDDDKPSTVTGQPGQRYLVADWVPEDMDLQHADMVSPDDEQFADWTSAVGEHVVYGDPSLEDPWDGPILAANRADDPDPDMMDLGRTGGVGMEEVTVGDAPGVIEEYAGSLFLRFMDGDVMLSVMSDGIERDDLLRAAENLTTDPAVAAEGLPEGYEEIARGPSGVAYGWAGIPIDGLALQYGAEGIEFDDPRDTPPGISVSQQSAGPEAVELIRLWGLEQSDDAEPQWELERTEVRGQDAYEVRYTSSKTSSGAAEECVSPDCDDSGPPDDYAEVVTEHETIVVQWYEPSLGLVITVRAQDQDEAEVMQFIEELRVAEDGELDGALESHSELPLSDGEDFAELVPAEDEAIAVEDEGVEGEAIPVEGEECCDGPVVDVPAERFIAEGTHAGENWVLYYTEHDVGAAFTLNWDSESTGWGGGRDGGGAGYDLSAEGGWAMAFLADEESVVVFGLVPQEAVEVTLGDVESSDGDEYALELYDINGVEGQAVIGFVPRPSVTFFEAKMTVLGLDGEPLPSSPVDIADDLHD